MRYRRKKNYENFLSSGVNTEVIKIQVRSDGLEIDGRGVGLQWENHDVAILPGSNQIEYSSLFIVRVETEQPLFFIQYATLDNFQNYIRDIKVALKVSGISTEYNSKMVKFLKLSKRSGCCW